MISTSFFRRLGASNRGCGEGNQTWRQNSLRFSESGRSVEIEGRNACWIKMEAAGVLYTIAALRNIPRTQKCFQQAVNRQAPDGVTFRGDNSACYDA
jgi:hypothetical protein